MTDQTCPDCGHRHTPSGCVGSPTLSDRWADVPVSACDCLGVECDHVAGYYTNPHSGATCWDCGAYVEDA